MKLDKSHIAILISIAVIIVGSIRSYSIIETQTELNTDLAKQALSRAKKADNSIAVEAIKTKLDIQATRLGEINDRLNHYNETLNDRTWKECSGKWKK